MASDTKSGSAYFTLTSGKEVGPYSAVLGVASERDGNYLDVTKGGKDYPTKLDFGKFKTVTGITFKPNMGKSQSWTSWSYFNNGQWAVDRFTNLS